MCITQHKVLLIVYTHLLVLSSHRIRRWTFNIRIPNERYVILNSHFKNFMWFTNELYLKKEKKEK